jgi:hypothetical protein
METYIERTDAGLKTQLETFSSVIDTYASSLGLDADKVTELKKAITYYSFVFNKNEIYHDYSKAIVQHKALVGKGAGGTVMVPFPALPALGTVPDAPAEPNVRATFGSMIQDAKRSANFTTSVASSLGVLYVPGSFNPEDGKPTFKISFSSGGHPNLIWVKGLYDGVEIWKDSGDGQGWKKLDKDFRPDFIDKSDLPAAGKSVVWKYKMIYIYKDDIAGQWSDEMSVTVVGPV